MNLLEVAWQGYTDALVDCGFANELDQHRITFFAGVDLANTVLQKVFNAELTPNEKARAFETFASHLGEIMDGYRDESR